MIMRVCILGFQCVRLSIKICKIVNFDRIVMRVAVDNLSGYKKIIAPAVVTILNIVAVMILWRNANHIYPLDDTYIHLSLARTLATNGVWGLTPFDPAAASSSPLYTLVIAALFLLTNGWIAPELLPLLVNVVFVPIVVGLIDKVLKPYSHSFGERLFALLCVTAVVPLPVMVLCGMEHTLQLAIFLAFGFVAVRIALGDQRLTSAQGIALMLLTAAVVGTRYEGLVLVAASVLLLAVKGHTRAAFFTVTGATVVVVLFGALWSSNGGWILPNSIIIKSLHSGGGVVQGIEAGRALAFLVTVMASVIITMMRSRTLTPLQWPTLFAALSLVYALALLASKAVGWLFRYEAAAIMLCMIALYAALDRSGRPFVKYFVFSAVVFGLMFRTIQATQLAMTAPDDRRWEHIGPAEFVQNFYHDRTIVANDIGVVSWLNPQTRLLDVGGLANNEMARLWLTQRPLKPESVRDWSAERGARIAIIQVCWTNVHQVLPDEWTLVSLWKGPRNSIFHDLYIGFFAVDPLETSELDTNMRHFRTPADVTVFNVLDKNSPLFGLTSRDVREIGCMLNRLDTWRRPG
jgi:hypothetical protein